MNRHIYITHEGCTKIFKATDYVDISDIVFYITDNLEEADKVASWAETANIGDEYDIGKQIKILIGE